MLELSEAMTVGALLRNESRGAHYKPEFPERDDENFLKTTIAKWTPEGPQISYEDVDVVPDYLHVNVTTPVNISSNREGE